MPGPATSEFRRSVLMRWICLLLMICGTFPMMGCATLMGFWRRPNQQLSAVPRPRFSDDPQLEEVVDHLNQNVHKLHAWRANNVKIRANNMPGLSGSLVVEEGHHLRMVVNSIAGHEVDMGSNDDVFWIWAKRMEPAYVCCKHEQIEVARQQMGVPFEPQWLMQALGVAPLDTQNLTMQIDPAAHQARLVQPMVSAHGQPMQKVMVVDLIHGVVIEHSIYDARGQKIAQARLDDFQVDRQSGAVLPHRVKLDWPQNQMTLVMNLGHVDINPTSIPSQIWDMPEIRGTQVVDLGRGAPPPIRIAAGTREGYYDVEDPSASDHLGNGEMGFETGDQEAEVPINRAIKDDPVEYKTAPIERPAARDARTVPQEPAKREWFDE